MMLADSHTHLLDERLRDRAASIVDNMAADGLDFIVENATSAVESRECVKFASEHKRVFCTIGVHPQLAGDYNDDFEAWALNLRLPELGKVVAVGEIGLDYYHMPFPKELQRAVFEKQIKLAHILRLPIVIHTRDAFADTMEVLIANKHIITHGLLFHCFSEGEHEVEAVRKHFDAYFAFGGGVTYPSVAEKSGGAIRAVPLDRMLLETDCPYLNPHACGGKKITNEPKNVRAVAEHIAGVLGIAVEKLAKDTLHNTGRFFGIRATI